MIFPDRLEWDILEDASIFIHPVIDSNLIFLYQVYIFKHKILADLGNKGRILGRQAFMQASKNAFIIFYVTGDCFR